MPSQNLAQKVAARYKKESALAGTVKVFQMILVSKLTQYDQRLEVKQPNIYRLGHLLKAANEVEDDLRGFEDRDDNDAMALLKKSLQKRFTPHFPPVDAVLKQIDAWVTSKKFPKLR